MVELAWICAMSGLLLGSVAALIPGFPGSAVALLGLVAFAGLTEFHILTPGALVLGALVTAMSAMAQLAGPVVAGRAAGGAAGSATGAALGAAFGAILPVPGAPWLCAVLGAVLGGVLASREGVIAWVRGVLGTAAGCLVGIAADLLGVVSLAAVLAVADFLAV